jgi:solute carrier family 25 carnitine/acylcarnitine transporter 20/29
MYGTPAYQIFQDVIKTRLQVYDLQHPMSSDSQPLLGQSQQPTRPSTLSIARSAYQNEGAAVFFRGIGICSARAFVVNAVQWAVRTFFANCYLMCTRR